MQRAHHKRPHEILPSWLTLLPVITQPDAKRSASSASSAAYRSCASCGTGTSALVVFVQPRAIASSQASSTVAMFFTSFIWFSSHRPATTQGQVAPMKVYLLRCDRASCWPAQTHHPAPCASAALMRAEQERCTLTATERALMPPPFPLPPRSSAAGELDRSGALMSFVFFMAAGAGSLRLALHSPRNIVRGNRHHARLRRLEFNDRRQRVAQALGRLGFVSELHLPAKNSHGLAERK